MRYRELRWPCDFPIRLQGTRGEFAGHIINVSGYGARILLGEDLEPGEKLMLDLASGRLPATVRWVRNGLMGLRFARQMPVRDISRIRGHRGGSRDMPRRPGAMQELR